VNSPRSSPSASPVSSDRILPGLFLSVTTAPLLLALVGAKAVAVAVRELGELTEEVFRGDRLPLLNLDNSNDPQPNESKSP
jgi:hypothetical protein